MMRRALLAAMALAVLPGTVAHAATHTVSIEGMKFSPAVITVQAGDTVVWHNKDIVPHTVTAAGKLDSGTVAAGQRWTWKATADGRVEYVCTFHPGMKGTVIVK